MSATTSDVLDQGLSLLANPEPVPAEQVLAMQYIRRRVTDLVVWGDLFEALGLYFPGSPHLKEREFDMGARRAVPDSFRRTSSPKG